MKNYITIAALLATGSAFANAAVGDTITLDSKLVYGETTESAWTAIQGISADTTYLDIDQLGWKDSTVQTFTINTGSMLVSDVALNDGEYFSIDTISLASRYSTQASTDYPATLTFKYNEITYTASSVYNYTESGKVGSVDFKLDKALEVDSLALGDIAVSITHSGASNESQFGIAVAQGQGGATLSGATPIYGSWNPVVRVSGSVIPEPSAFGLLAGLGALALVGTRRRR